MKSKFLFLLGCISVFALVMISGCAKHEHTYGAWVVTSEASCLTDGQETRTCECGDTQTQYVWATGHNYKSWVTKTKATCIAEGLETRTCHCGEKETRKISKTSHSYGNWTITTAATCQNTGERVGTCTVCDATTTETLAKQAHNYDSGKVTAVATCQKEGVKTYTCTICNTTKTETITKLAHTPNGNNICTSCGANCPIELNMTASEIADAKKIEWIAERKITDLDDENKFRLMFSLKDGNEDWLKVPVIVTMKITNDNGEVVYNKTKIVKVSDYSTWTNNSGKEWVAAAIYIPYTDIIPGTTTAGNISFEVYNDYVSFDTSTLTISRGLPLKSSKINVPSVPKVIHNYGYSDSIKSSVKITSVTYKVSGDDLYIYFAGEKTYDKEGNNYSRTCEVGWKLYDSEGYIVDSGTFYSPGIAVGEKFRDEEEIAWDVIKPGKSYRLEIYNVD